MIYRFFGGLGDGAKVTFNPELLDKNGNTPLHVWLKQGHKDLVAYVGGMRPKGATSYHLEFSDDQEARYMHTHTYQWLLYNEEATSE